MGPTGAFEALSNDLVCLILEKTLHPKPPGIDSATLASLACVSRRYAFLVKDFGWERLCRKAVPEFCKAVVTADKKSPGDAGWDSFAKLLINCPGYDLTRVTQVKNFWSAYLGIRTVAELEGKQTKDLDTCEVEVGSHTSDSWRCDKWCSQPTTLEGCFRTGNDVLPGLGGSILLLTCSGRPWPGWHDASITQSGWTCKESGNQWVQKRWDEPRSGLVVVYRGMAVGAGAALSFPAAERIYEDVPSALAGSKKAEGGHVQIPLSAKHCPFCSRPMQRIPKSLYSKELQQKSQTAEFHICEVGHVFGASVEEDPPEEVDDEDDIEGGYSSQDFDLEEDGDEDLDEDLDQDADEDFSDEEEDEESDKEEDKSLDKYENVDEEEDESEEEDYEDEDEFESHEDHSD